MRNYHWYSIYYSLVYAYCISLFADLIPDWGQWYSDSPHYRTQIESLLHGKLALSDNPSDLSFDLCWSEGGVHQVWGLGIPLWRLPFELLARIVGQAAFPDMIAMALTLAGAAYILFTILYIVGRTGKIYGSLSPLSDESDRWIWTDRFGKNAWMVGTILLLLFFPPFLSLLRSRLAIYEEVIVYEYAYSLVLISLLLLLNIKPCRFRYWFLCGLAGCGGLVRPTLVFHGIACVLAGTVIMYYHTSYSVRNAIGLKNKCIGRFQWKEIIFGFLMFAIGEGVLYYTNMLRFGHGLEFGHKLNVQTLYGSMYATRFDDPFRQEPWISAVRELFGLLFFTKDIHGTDFYGLNLVGGQSATIRWRQIYLTTYDISYVLPLLGGLAAGFEALRQFRGMKQKPEIASLISPICILSLVIYGGLGSILHSLFYLRNGVICSRYMLDFMPSFAALMLAGWWGWVNFWCRRKMGHWVTACSSIILAGWTLVECLTGKCGYPRAERKTWEMVHVQRNVISRWDYPPVVGVYDSAEVPLASNIPFNGAGWQKDNEATKPCVVLFVTNPSFLEMEVAFLDIATYSLEPTQIQAKIGLELLEREWIHKQDNSWTIRFKGPTESRYRIGLQPVFIATVPYMHLADHTTPCRLLKVRWK